MPDSLLQGEHLHGKPGKCDHVSCQWNVTEFTKSLGSVGAKILSGKSGLKLFIVSCVLVSIPVLSRTRRSKQDYLLVFKIVLTLLSLCIAFWFWIMHCCIPTPTTDNNTITSMVWVTLDIGRSAANHQGNVVEFHIGEWSPSCYLKPKLKYDVVQIWLKRMKSCSAALKFVFCK